MNSIKIKTYTFFFSLPGFSNFFTDEDDKKPLNILHDIISKFDQLMYEPQFNRIEKIKIIQSTFMAACGLFSGRKLSLEYDTGEEASKVHCSVVEVDIFCSRGRMPRPWQSTPPG